MNISKNISPFLIPRILIFLGLTISLICNAQEIQLEKINQYSFLTGRHSGEPVASSHRAFFMQESIDSIFFSLSTREPGGFASSIFGKIENEFVTLLDTASVHPFPGDLSEIGYENDIYYSIELGNSSYSKRLDLGGTTLWITEYSTDSIITKSKLQTIAPDGSVLVVARSRSDHTIGHNTHLMKLDPDTGDIIWKTDSINQSASFTVPELLKAYEDSCLVFSSVGGRINLATIDLHTGALLSSITKPNPSNVDISRQIGIDEQRNIYPGLNAWGYRVPKLNAELDSLWFYEKLSSLNDEIGNRTKTILIDDSLNVYVGGPFRFIDNERSSFLVTKLDKDGFFLWEKVIQDIEFLKSQLPKQGFLFNDYLWYSIDQFDDNDQISGAIVCLDLNGNIVLYHELEETLPYGRVENIDVLDQDILVTCSSGPEYLSDSIYQHIIHYRIDTLTSSTTKPTNSILIEPYPNPTTGWVSIFHLPQSQIKDLSITDMNGRKIATPKGGLADDKINLGHLTDGLYIISYRVEDQVYLAKVIKSGG